MKTLDKYTTAELEPFAKEWLRRMRGDRATTPKVQRPCPYCGNLFGAREMRTHQPHCPKKSGHQPQEKSE